MSRSISYPNDADQVAFLDIEEYIDDQFPMDYWEALKDDIIFNLREAFPSVRDSRATVRWIDGESRIIGENEHGIFTLSEYERIAAVAVLADPLRPDTGLSARWRSSINLHRALNDFPLLQRIGTASNGESFFRPINRTTT